MAERRVGRPWTAREDQLLANAVAVHGQVDNWKAVALSVPGRTNKASRKRWLHSLSPSVKKTAWTKEEDNLLLELYNVHSAKWAVIARNIPGRTDDACSKRYREALDPSLKKDEWTPEEDEKLTAAYTRLGGKWGQVGQELQRSGLSCRNRLLERKRTTAPLGDPQGATASKTTPTTATQLGPTLNYCDPSTWPSLPMTEPSSYWDESLSQVDTLPSGPSVSHGRSPNGDGLLGDPPSAVQHAQLVPQLVNYPAPFHYSSSSLSSALSSPQPGVRYEKDAEATTCNGRQSQVPATASAPPDNTSIPVFAPFDYESASSTCTVSVGSTSPAPQAAYTHDMHPSDSYNDCTSQFHQLHRSVPHTSIPIHTPSPVRPVQVDHYTATVRHEGRSHSHNALMTGHRSTPQSSSLRALSSAEAYFATSQFPEQQGDHISSSMSSGLLLDRSDPYHHTSPQPQLDVNAQYGLLHASDPLSLSESRSDYHYAHPRDVSRARGMETTHGQEQHGEYLRSHVESSLSHHVHPLSRPPTTSPPEPQYVLQRSAHHNPSSTTSPEPGPSRVTHSQYYASSHVQPSQLVQRAVAGSRSTGAPYMKRPLQLDGSTAGSVDSRSSSLQPVSRQKSTTNVPRKRPDAQAPLRLSSDLPATPDPSVKPYACGHESCWPSNAVSSRACFCTSRGLSDHSKAAHLEDSGGDRPYRCGLEGCGKSWKSINGLQYHLQISKAHFQHAIISTYAVPYVTGLTVPASVEASTLSEGEEKTKKQYKCPHKNCPNRYKQLSGLRYHLAHGHPTELPRQLDLVPPALSRKLEEKMRIQGSALPSSDHQPATNGSAPSSHATQGSTSNS